MGSPVYLDSDPVAQRILFFGAAILSITGFALAILLARDYAITSARVLLHVGIGIAGAASLWNARQKMFGAAALILIGAYWLGAASVTLINGGIRGPNLVNFPLIIVMTSWLLGSRSTLSIAAVTGLFFFSLLIADSKGVVGTADYSNPFAYVIFLTAVISATAMATTLARNGYLRKMQEAQNNAAALADREIQLKAHLEHLESIVQDRTVELSKAKERAELASAAKGSFLSSISHEIRTPLYAITGMAYLVRSGLTRNNILSSEQLDQLNKLDAASAHLLDLINNVLDFSKIEAGKLELREEPVNLNSLVQQVVDQPSW